MDLSKKKAVCLISGRQIEMMEKALSEGKRIEISPSPTGNIKIKVVYRKELMYND